MKRLLAFIVGMGILLMPAMAMAAESVLRFDVEAVLDADGQMQITETITYDFDDLQRHGIYRYIPYKYHDESGRDYYLRLEMRGVTDLTGQPWPYETNNSGSNLIYKIGDPNRTVTGSQSYILRYSLGPIVRRVQEVDLLAWDVVGEGWNVPIQQVNATLITKSKRPSELQCLSIATCNISGSGSRVALEAFKVLPGQAVTLEAKLPAGSVSGYAVAVPVLISAVPALGFAAGFAMFLLAGTTWLYWKFKDRHEQKRRTIIARYQPPAEMSPAQVGLLDENRSGMPEVTATLIDVARKGFIRIEQTKAKTLFSKAKYTLHKLKDFKGLHSIEQDLLKALFADMDKVVLDKVDKTKVSASIQRMHRQLVEDLEAAGYYATKPSFGNWLGSHFGRLMLVGGVIITGLSLLYVIYTPEWGLAIFGWLTFWTGGLSGYLFWRLKRRTSKGIARWRDIAGFKWYLTVAEKDRLKFHEAPAKTPKLFSQLLPYAVALGVEEQWARQFEGIDLSHETDWYAGPVGYHFSGVALASDLSSSFSPAVSASFVSSSGSSGGFSGGGFGGGGGGSW